MPLFIEFKKVFFLKYISDLSFNVTKSRKTVYVLELCANQSYNSKWQRERY